MMNTRLLVVRKIDMCFIRKDSFQYGKLGKISERGKNL